MADMILKIKYVDTDTGVEQLALRWMKCIATAGFRKIFLEEVKDSARILLVAVGIGT